MTQPQFEIVNWEEIFQTLSLDVAAPYFGHMGLLLPDGFVAGLRTRLAEQHKRQTEGDGALDTIPQIVEWMGDSFGPSFVEYLHAWGNNIFRLGEDNGASVFLWTMILKYGSSSRQEPVLPSPAFILRFREILTQIPPLDIYSQGPTSTWDRFIYEWRDETNNINPMELVQSTIDNYNFRRAWMLTLRDMPDPERMAEVVAWGKLVAARKHMPPDRLGPPGAWTPLPPLWTLG